jgi:glycosyltransferase involved in cell wall biosynthesis
MHRELVVVDGASTDRTVEIVQGFESPLVQVHSARDRGIYDALNKGIARATGDVVGILHSNDYFASPTILNQVAEAFADPNLDAVFADVTFFPPGKPDRVVRRYRSNRFRPALLAYGLMPAHPTLYLRRRVFERFGVYRTDFRIAGDFEFIARIFRENRISYRYVEDVWTRMETGGASTGGLRSKMVINAEVLRACRDLGISTSYARLLARYPRKVLEMFH